MTHRVIISMLSAILLGVSLATAQTNVIVSRSTGCTINPGYTMADVVETARNFAWSEDAAPQTVLVLEGVAVAGDNPQYDFILDSFFPSYADMVEKVGTFLQRQAGENGRRGLSGVATCNDNVWIRSVRLATPIPEDVTIAPLTAIASTLCQLNGASTADAVALANTYRENIGAVGGVVLTRRFGGPRRPLNSAVGMRFIFENFAAFGAGMDALEQMAPTANPGNPISCSTGTLSRSYRIYSQNN
jgi:hypothetical protein